MPGCLQRPASGDFRHRWGRGMRSRGIPKPSGAFSRESPPLPSARSALVFKRLKSNHHANLRCLLPGRRESHGAFSIMYASDHRMAPGGQEVFPPCPAGRRLSRDSCSLVPAPWLGEVALPAQRQGTPGKSPAGGAREACRSLSALPALFQSPLLRSSGSGRIPLRSWRKSSACLCRK